METQHRIAWDRVMRVSHLYAGLFLVPWMTVYALSAFLLNHSTWFANLAPKWVVVRQVRIPMKADTCSNRYRTPFRGCRTVVGAKRRAE